MMFPYSLYAFSIKFQLNDLDLSKCILKVIIIIIIIFICVYTYIMIRSPGSDISLFLLLRFIAILIRFIELLYRFIELL